MDTTAITIDAIRPLCSQVVVRQDPPKKTLGKLGIIVAIDGQEDWPPIATVLKIGPGYRDAAGRLWPMDLQPGDRVLFKRQPDSALVWDAREGDPNGLKDVLVLDYANILAVVDGEVDIRGKAAVYTPTDISDALE